MQVECLCEAIQQRGDINLLAHFLCRLPAEQQDSSEAVLRARARVAYEQGHYKQLYAILESQPFSPRHHPELQQVGAPLWLA